MAAKKDDPLQEIVESSKGSVVCLKTKFIGLTAQSGSGFFVAPDKIATNIHVIEGIPGFKVKAITAKQLDIEKTPISNRISQSVRNAFRRLFRGSAVTGHTIEGVLGYDDKNDLVLLKVAETGVSLPFGDIDTLDSDEQVYIVGYEGTQYKGIAGTIPNKNNRNTEFDIKIKGSHTDVDGHSGGPVLNSKGEVIGVVVSAEGPESNKRDEVVYSFVNVIPLTVLETLLANSGKIESIAAWRKRPQIRAYTITGLGSKKLKAGKPEKAIERYDAALQLNPNLAATYLKRGDAKRKLDDFEGAIEDYDSAVKLNPEKAVAYVNRGVAKRRLDDSEGAIEDYDSAIKLNPEDATAHNNRGVARRRLGNFKGAITDYNNAIELDSECATAHYNRGFAKKALDDFEGAITDYDTVIKLNPEDGNAYFQRGFAKQQLGDFEGAIVDYDSAIKLNPEYALAYKNRGRAKKALGQHEAAEADFAKAKELDSNTQK